MKLRITPTKPIVKEILVPYITLENKSLPNLSVPNKNMGFLKSPVPNKCIFVSIKPNNL